MQIVIISLDRELYAMGVRILSACLREAGHDTRCVFMATGHESVIRDKSLPRYSEKVLDELTTLCSDADLIGLSLMTHELRDAIQVTEHLKKRLIQAPIIWGGIHPTTAPDLSLQYADMVCVGEGEDTLVELADRMSKGEDYSDVANLAFAGEQGIVQNPVRPLVHDLNRLPLPDYSGHEHYIAQPDHIEPLNAQVMLNFKGPRFESRDGRIGYPLITSRGCFFACTYCCNDIYNQLYPGQKRLRWRSNEHVMRELAMIRELVAPLFAVYIVDDDFTARSRRDLEQFVEVYKQEIGLPFSCQVSPITVSKEKLDILFDAGCLKITMGVETASERVAGIYNRTRHHAHTKEAIALVESYRPRMAKPPTFQFIIDNPYETLDETLATLKLALSLSRPWDNPIYSLMLFPGTSLYHSAKADGLLTDEFVQIYDRMWHQQSRPLFQFWIRLYRANLLPSLLGFLLIPWVARLLTHPIADKLWRTPFLRWLWQKKA
jgi:radical SAM superfamily enzyme YgiQ (UPF0313 family)